jgi:hypothetical protein
MTTSNAARTQAVYNAVAAQPGFDALSDAEKAKVKAQLATIFGTDLAYLVGNITVLPTALRDPGGAPVAVSTTSGTGSVTGPTAIAGTGVVA